MPLWWGEGRARPPPRLGAGYAARQPFLVLSESIGKSQNALSEIYSFHRTAGQGHRSKTRSRGHEVKSFQIRKFEIAKIFSILCCVDISKDF